MKEEFNEKLVSSSGGTREERWYFIHYKSEIDI